MSVKEEIHAQIVEALKGAKFPIKTPEALLSAFPDGANTTCQVGDIKMTAGEAGKLLKGSDFPFKSAKQVADTIVQRAGL
ncbi:MTH865-like family protein [uncultured archaeon]|nr:MTH865-like family protein [uncultured archaeon]